MNKKQILFVSIIIISIIIIGFIALNFNKVFKESSLDLNAEILNNADDINDLDSEVDEDNRIESAEIEFVNMSKLTNYLTSTEVDDLEKNLSQLFTELFPRIASVRGNYSNFYSQNIQEIQDKTGIESEKEFISLVNKIKRVQDYKSLKLVLQSESLTIVENRYFVDFNAIYDQNREVEFYIIIDMNNLGLVIK